MKTLTPEQRIEGFSKLKNENGRAHLASFLAGIAHAEKVLGEEQDDEPVDISDKSEPTVAAILPNGVRVTNVYEAYEAGLKAGTEPDDETWEKGFRQGIQFAKARYGVCTMPPEPEQDEGPVAWMFFSSKGRPHYHLNEYQALEGLKMYGGSKVIALYEHPAPRKQDDEPVAIRDAYTAGLFDGKALTPRKSFMRLSEKEIVSWWGVATEAGLIEFARAIEDALEEKNK